MNNYTISAIILSIGMIVAADMVGININIRQDKIICYKQTISDVPMLHRIKCPGGR